MKVQLPELAEGWRWNQIKESTTGSGKNLGKEYVVSASRASGLPNYYSHTLWVSLRLDRPEEIQAAFDEAFESVAAATNLPKHPYQENYTALDEIIAGFNKERLKEYDE